VAGVIGVLGGKTVADDGCCAGVTDTTGGFPEPAQRLLRGPCWCTIIIIISAGSSLQKHWGMACIVVGCHSCVYPRME